MNQASAAWPSESPELEAALVARLQARDEAAYEELIRLYWQRLLFITQRYLGQEQDAQDAVQDAFISAFRNIDRFQGDSRLATWLHRIAVNSALMRLRKQRRHPQRSIEDLLPRFQSDGHRDQPGPAWNVSLDEALQQRETREVVRRSIDALPDTYRSVLLLRDIEGQSTEEAAQVLETTPNAVKTRLHRARQALKTLLDPYMHGETA